MENNFDLKKFLVENKLTSTSKHIKEQSLSKEELINQLINLSSNGELDAEEINSINHQLKSARRKMFSSKITPDQRKASAEKASATKANEKKLKAAQKQVYKVLGIEDDLPTQFALDLGRHNDKELQNRFDAEVQKILDK